ncbi:MAG: DNRLRE domain-containing protein [Phycisphaerales bacterium]
MRREIAAAIAVGIGAAALGDASHAGIVSIVADRDATIYDSGALPLANGAGQYLFCGKNGNGQARRGLISFDLSSIGPGVTITSATLTLHYSQGQATTTIASLHRATASWTQGPTDPDGNEGGGAPAQVGDVTWTDRTFGGAQWATPGGDFDPNASAATAIGADFGIYAFTSAAMAGDVQAWLDGARENHGWFLVGDESAASTAKRFDSSENSKIEFRPTLVIEYVVPAPGCIALCSLALVRFRRRPR